MAKGPSNKQAPIFALIFLVFVGIAIAAFSFVQTRNGNLADQVIQNDLSLLRSELYDLMIISDQASLGDTEALSVLPVIQDSIRELQASFTAGAGDLDPAEVRQFNAGIDAVLGHSGTIEQQSDNVQFLIAQLELLELRIPAIQDAYNSVVDTMLQVETPADQVAEAQAQVFRAERMLTSLNSIVASDADPATAAEQFRNDVLVFTQVINGMLEGNRILGISAVTSPQASALLNQIDEQFGGISDSIQAIQEAAPALTLTRAAATDILSSGVELLDFVQSLSNDITALPGQRFFSDTTTIIGSALAVIFILITGIQFLRRTQSDLAEQEETNSKNQEAILRLLDEIADLGDGDLTVQATVTEDFTGAIADSINYAIEQLRDLVGNVAMTAENVAASSNETRATAQQLTEASELQSLQITDATEAINSITFSMAEASKEAARVANQALGSVESAKRGSDVVSNTIHGMDSIREQIQDTSKRIKRLGESSQEIGNIVSLINEIADQTNILALNASIQAAMAGEAGRGFAVVADEVQSLAERAASSTRQIESLVKTIQSDTNEAVASMEQTTTEVVRGAELANRAGDALSTIQRTSEDVANLINRIANSTNEQSQSANRVSGSMRVIQDITQQTLAGAGASGRATGELAELAIALRQSVADFKLPADSLASTSILHTSSDSVVDSDTGFDEEDVDFEALPEDALAPEPADLEIDEDSETPSLDDLLSEEDVAPQDVFEDENDYDPAKTTALTETGIQRQQASDDNLFDLDELDAFEEPETENSTPQASEGDEITFDEFESEGDHPNPDEDDFFSFDLDDDSDQKK